MDYKNHERLKGEELVCFMDTRMAAHSLVQWLLLMVAVCPSLVLCQHWSYGLNPGGKRDLDVLPDALSNLVEGFPHVDAPCSVLGCAEESPFAKIYRTKGFLGGVTDRESGHRTYKK